MSAYKTIKCAFKDIDFLIKAKTFKLNEIISIWLYIFFDIDLLKLRLNNILRTKQQWIDKFKTNSGAKPWKELSNKLDQKFIERSIAIVMKNLDNTNFSWTWERKRLTSKDYLQCQVFLFWVVHHLKESIKRFKLMKSSQNPNVPS